ncbi:hypothetical protein K7C98_10285 [Nannocystis pusilla]|uniref:Uncharacterized protein n=2 Tax=Nannocystis pusilla TaxID=889268 RepID=A0ABS7TN47_9BACT|nr:hypothetical protein [Nannocystis pusilla]
MVTANAKVLEQLDGVPAGRLKELLVELRERHGPDATLLVDGKDVSAALVPTKPKPDREAPPRPKRAREVTVRQSPLSKGEAAPRGKEWEGVELAHHMLWESYERAAFIQSYMLEQMTSNALEMNRKFCDQVQEHQDRFQAAMQKLDVMSWEHKMIEHETAGRRLSAHFRRMAADERKEDDSPLDWLEGVARGLGRAFAAFGDGSDDTN